MPYSQVIQTVQAHGTRGVGRLDATFLYFLPGLGRGTDGHGGLRH